LFFAAIGVVALRRIVAVTTERLQRLSATRGQSEEREGKEEGGR